MHPQLSRIDGELREASARLRRLAARVPPERWPQRADPDRWSAAECVEHLNLTSRAFLPPLREAVDRARALGGGAPARFRRDPVGWLLWAVMPPPVRVRARTPAAFVPDAPRDPEASVEEFERLQGELLELLRAADGLPLHRVRMRSPFAERVRYSAFSALSILPRHQHRHLWQAERVHPETAAPD